MEVSEAKSEEEEEEEEIIEMESGDVDEDFKVEVVENDEVPYMSDEDDDVPDDHEGLSKSKISGVQREIFSDQKPSHSPD